MGSGQLFETGCSNMSCGLFGVLRILGKRAPQEIGNTFQLRIGDDLAAIC